jgi:uncharacterized membrane protein
MIGCLIVGGLTLFAVSRVIGHRRWCGGPGGWHRHHHGWHGGWHQGWHGHAPGYELGDEGPGPGERGWGSFGDEPFAGGGGMGKRFLFRRIAEHVRATPEQERRLSDAVAEFRDEMKKSANGEGPKSRHEIADALRRPTFDGITLGEQFARHDTVLEGARKAFVGLVARIHDTLEPEQRGRLADLVERGPRFGRPGFGRSWMGW